MEPRAGIEPVVNKADWTKGLVKIMEHQRARRAALLRFRENPEAVSDADREAARQYMDDEFAAIQSLAEFFGVTAERFGAYPEDLPIPLNGGSPFVDPSRREYVQTRQLRPFARVSVGDRAYVFSLILPGNVNVYIRGQYFGGNHDMSLEEVFAQLQSGGNFGTVGTHKVA